MTDKRRTPPIEDEERRLPQRVDRLEWWALGVDERLDKQDVRNEKAQDRFVGMLVAVALFCVTVAIGAMVALGKLATPPAAP